MARFWHRDWVTLIAQPFENFAVDIVYDPCKPGVRDSRFFDVNKDGQSSSHERIHQVHVGQTAKLILARVAKQ